MNMFANTPAVHRVIMQRPSVVGAAVPVPIDDKTQRAAGPNPSLRRRALCEIASIICLVRSADRVHTNSLTRQNSAIAIGERQGRRTEIKRRKRTAEKRFVGHILSPRRQRRILLIGTTGAFESVVRAERELGIDRTSLVAETSPSITSTHSKRTAFVMSPS